MESSDVVVGVGGYVSVPAVAAAVRLRRPVVLHEQNSVPGLANRWLARPARVVAVSFAETAADSNLFHWDNGHRHSRECQSKPGEFIPERRPFTHCLLKPLSPRREQIGAIVHRLSGPVCSLESRFQQRRRRVLIEDLAPDIRPYFVGSTRLFTMTCVFPPSSLSRSRSNFLKRSRQKSSGASENSTGFSRR